MCVRVVIVSIAVGLSLLRVSAAQLTSETRTTLRAEAEAAIRAGRPADAVALLESGVRRGAPDETTRLVYLVALISDNRADAAETELATLERSGGVSAAQI